MTILHPERTRTGPAVMPHEPVARYQYLSNLKGLWIILISGDCAVEGWLVEVARPNMTSETPAPLVTLETGHSSLVGPVLSGDIVAAPPCEGGSC